MTYHDLLLDFLTYIVYAVIWGTVFIIVPISFLAILSYIYKAVAFSARGVLRCLPRTKI